MFFLRFRICFVIIFEHSCLTVANFSVSLLLPCCFMFILCCFVFSVWFTLDWNTSDTLPLAYINCVPRYPTSLTNVLTYQEPIGPSSLSLPHLLFFSRSLISSLTLHNKSPWWLFFFCLSFCFGFVLPQWTLDLPSALL